MQQPRPRSLALTSAAFCVLLALCWALYRPSLDDYFIADDFVNLKFVRDYQGSWWGFLDPREVFSDPVTETRYKPGYIYYFALLDTLFGDSAVRYHLLSLTLHAATATAVLLLAYQLTRDRTQAVAAGVLFATSRLHVQTVVWVSSHYRLPSTGLALAAILVLSAPRRWSAIAASVGLFTFALAMNPELIVLPPILGLFAICHRRAQPVAPELARRSLVAMAFDLPIAAAFVYASRLSNARFAELPISAVPDPERMLLFVANVFVPFEVPLASKIAVVIVIVATAVRTRDPVLAVLLASVGLGAGFWGMLRGYTLAPRYLYLSSAFASVLLVRMFSLLATGITARLRPSRISPEGCSTMGLAALALPLVLTSLIAVRTFDLVEFDYLALLGERLSHMQHAARSRRQRVRVFVAPASHLSVRDLRFFAPEIEFVESRAAATSVVETGFERYRARLGPGLAQSYWYLPWFQLRLAL